MRMPFWESTLYDCSSQVIVTVKFGMGARLDGPPRRLREDGVAFCRPQHRASTEPVEDAVSEQPTSQKPSVALLGLGTMGAGMARNLAAAGFPLRVWNRTTEKARPLAEVGAEVAATPAEAVAGAQIVLTMLFDAQSVAEVIAEAGEALTPGTIWVQTSTV